MEEFKRWKLATHTTLIMMLYYMFSHLSTFPDLAYSPCQRLLREGVVAAGYYDKDPC